MKKIDQETARWLAGLALDTLREKQLRVVLVPAPEPMHCGHKVRHVEEQNPQWYREFHYSRRCRVKRGRVVRSLRKAAAGYVRTNGYAREIIKILHGYLSEGGEKGLYEALELAFC